MMKVRFIAEWVEQDVFRNGELQPDLAVHGYATLNTFDTANDVAQQNAQAFGIVDWWAVEEQHLERVDGRMQWNTERRWIEGCEINC